MSYDPWKMLRQRAWNYFRIPTFFLALVSLFFVLFLFRPRLMVQWSGDTGSVAKYAMLESSKPPQISPPATNNAPPDSSQPPPISPPPATKNAIPDSSQPPPISPPATKRRATAHHIKCSESKVCSSSPTERKKWDPESRPSCPAYFGYIYEDLKPWRKSGITLKMVETFKNRASFRLTIVEGRMYITTYHKSFQTRDVFSLWGFVQLMDYYPGMLPDLDLMFDCVDWPVVKANEYSDANPPPPIFRYCADDSTLDIPFPDWSFWGWAEINIGPWEGLLEDIRKGNRKIKWEDRDPTAYWKGNPFVADVRQDLMKCNASQGQDWNARLYIQDWIKESQEGYKQSKLSDQCDHRYKIYVEGSAWSVSLKNILACDSTTFVVKPQYHDFFSRRLIPLEHYWPVGLDNKCQSVKLAVDWGNNHTNKAKALGKAASNFLKNEVNMSNVYDYMFHMLAEYAKLLKYKPSIPSGAREICTRSMYCTRKHRVERRFMQQSMVKVPNESGPCNLPSAATSYESINDWNERKAKAIRQVEEMERKAQDKSSTV